MPLKSSRVILSPIKKRAKGKGSFTYNIEIDVPGMVGSVDAQEAMVIFANEAADYIRWRFHNGQAIDGTPRTITEGTRRHRTLDRGALEDPTGPSTLTTKQKKARARRVSSARKKYTYRRQGTREVDGIEKKYYRKVLYIPNPTGTAVDASGLMVASLHGRFMPARSFYSKPLQKQVNLRSAVVFAVVKSRTWAAGTFGLDDGSADLLYQAVDTSPHFKETRDFIDNRLAWQDDKNTLTKIIFAVRLMARLGGVILKR